MTGVRPTLPLRRSKNSIEGIPKRREDDFVASGRRCRDLLPRPPVRPKGRACPRTLLPCRPFRHNTGSVCLPARTAIGLIVFALAEGRSRYRRASIRRDALQRHSSRTEQDGARSVPSWAARRSAGIADLLDRAGGQFDPEQFVPGDEAACRPSGDQKIPSAVPIRPASEPPGSRADAAQMWRVPFDPPMKASVRPDYQSLIGAILATDPTPMAVKP